MLKGSVTPKFTWLVSHSPGAAPRHLSQQSVTTDAPGATAYERLASYDWQIAQIKGLQLPVHEADAVPAYLMAFIRSGLVPTKYVGEMRSES